VNFIAEFSGFCEHFALTGMATWELPDPQGPQWPAILPADRHEGQDTFATPFHFPLQYSDGLGQRTIERHAETAEARGVSDLGRWETYAALFDIDIFEAVITQRYQQHRRPVGFVRELENILADITGLELERIAKLRKVRNALKEGRRNSLDGWR
jgi:hypothetical protein